MPQGETRQDT